jgi:hypothetical protein
MNKCGERLFSGVAKPDYFLSVISEQANFILEKKEPLPITKIEWFMQSC